MRALPAVSESALRKRQELTEYQRGGTQQNSTLGSEGSAEYFAGGGWEKGKWSNICDI